MVARLDTGIGVCHLIFYRPNVVGLDQGKGLPFEAELSCSYLLLIDSKTNTP